MAVKSLTPPWLDRTLFPFRSRSVDIDGNMVHYVDEGQGPVLLLLHGNGSWSFLYRHMILVLSRHYRCVALDYPGFGLSTARAGYTFRPEEHSAVVEKFAAALGLHDIGLVVQDWGGPIGLGFAGRCPDRIRVLFICNTWAWPTQDIKHIATFSRVAGSGFARLLITRLNLFVTLLVPAAINRKLTAAERAAYTGPFPTVRSRRPLALLPKEILESRDYLERVEAGLKRLSDKPVLLLWGDADSGFREGELRRFQTMFPNSRTRMLRGAKHYVQENAPADICASIFAFEGLPHGEAIPAARVSG